MTKLVDVQGLKPCPKWGSGSSPDTGSIYYIYIFILFSVFVSEFLYPNLLFNILIPYTNFALFLNSW